MANKEEAKQVTEPPKAITKFDSSQAFCDFLNSVKDTGESHVFQARVETAVFGDKAGVTFSHELLSGMSLRQRYYGNVIVDYTAQKITRPDRYRIRVGSQGEDLFIISEKPFQLPQFEGVYGRAAAENWPAPNLRVIISPLEEQ